MCFDRLQWDWDNHAHSSKGLNWSIAIPNNTRPPTNHEPAINHVSRSDHFDQSQANSQIPRQGQCQMSQPWDYSAELYTCSWDPQSYATTHVQNITFHICFAQIQPEDQKNMLQTTDQSLITTASNFPKCRNPLVWCRSCPRLPVLLRQTPQLHNDKRVSKGRPWLDKGNDTVIWPTYLRKTLTFLRTIVPNWFQHLFETLKACCKGLIGKI